MTQAAAGVVWLAVGVLAAARLHVLLHALQQEHYENARLRVWLGRDARRYGVREAAVVALGVAVVFVAALVSGVAALVVAALGLVGAGARARAVWRRPQVKALVFTKRARRLFVVALVLALIAPALAAVFVPGAGAPLATGALGVAALLGAPWLLCWANVLLRPVQRLETQRFVRAARRRLADVAPLVVGITGSYGKTTTKACVAAVLDAAGRTYPTPASFNSYLGVVRAINEGLEPDHHAFVVEMGAYREGDVAELCELTQPRIGVLTAIGPAHLERFGSLDVTERAKGELAAALPPQDGVFITRADDERCRRVAAQRARCRVVLFAPEPHPDAHLWAEDVELQDGRTAFTIVTRDGERAAVRSHLLGAHNIANLLAGVAVGLAAGVTLAQAARKLAGVTPPEHRLAPIVNAGAGVVVIDDSYNANPVGAAAALEVLRAHPAARRILVTPGLVELGDQERTANREFGTLAAAACDICVLSGSRAADIRDGLLAAGFDAGHIVVTPDGPSAHAQIAQLSRRGDVILFENDLPDVYA